MKLKIVKWPENRIICGMKHKWNENGNGMKNKCHGVEMAEFNFVN